MQTFLSIAPLSTESHDESWLHTRSILGAFQDSEFVAFAHRKNDHGQADTSARKDARGQDCWTEAWHQPQANMYKNKGVITRLTMNLKLLRFATTRKTNEGRLLSLCPALKNYTQVATYCTKTVMQWQWHANRKRRIKSMSIWGNCSTARAASHCSLNDSTLLHSVWKATTIKHYVWTVSTLQHFVWAVTTIKHCVWTVSTLQHFVWTLSTYNTPCTHYDKPRDNVSALQH